MTNKIKVTLEVTKNTLEEIVESLVQDYNDNFYVDSSLKSINEAIQQLTDIKNVITAGEKPVTKRK